jgi:hypothetical protein
MQYQHANLLQQALCSARCCLYGSRARELSKLGEFIQQVLPTYLHTKTHQRGMAQVPRMAAQQSTKAVTIGIRHQHNAVCELHQAPLAQSRRPAHACSSALCNRKPHPSATQYAVYCTAAPLANTHQTGTDANHTCNSAPFTLSAEQACLEHSAFG